MLWLFKRKSDRRVAMRLYDQMVLAARAPVFYQNYGVPDTLDGRFECITLHVFALMFRLKNETVDPDLADRIAQALFDAMFRDIEQSLRQMGVGDLSVPKKMKIMMKSFNGRCLAYTNSIQDQTLGDALRRNLYGTISNVRDTDVKSIENYTLNLIAELMKKNYTDVIAGHFTLPPLLEINHEKAA